MPEVNETHGERRSINRRTLISMIVVLAIIQVAILAYLWRLLGPSAPQGAAGPTPALQFELPSAASTSLPGDVRPTPTTDAAQTVVGPPVRATGYAARARMFDEEQALDHLAYLASDGLGGRQPGTLGGRAAGDYVAARFAEYGLEPAGVESTYFQTFTVPYGQITQPPLFTIIPPRGETLTHTYAYRTDYRALTGGYLGAGAGEGPVVWLNECLHDDYAGLDPGLDMVGKIALCHYTGNPAVYRQAIEHQVGGLLLLEREREDETFRRGGYRETAWVPQTIPAYLIAERVAHDLLLGTDYTLDDLSLRFVATPLSTTVRMRVAVEEQEEVEARNVLGLLPGSDPERSDEIVVIGAHYDHLGRDPDGAINNGANDNASGVATVLEIARLWQAQHYRPARSVLFAAWDGEEQGLLGSLHYVSHPTLPLTQTVATVNLDMVGAGEALRIDGEGAVAVQLRASAEAYGITTTLTFDGRSDHFAFHQAGVPAAMFIYWPDVFYHTPDDEADTIVPEHLKTVGVLSAHTLATLADEQVRLEQAVERLRASIAAGDRDAFLEGLDPADPDLQAAQAAWFDNLWSRELTEVTAEPGRMRVGDGEADVALTLAYRWAETARREPTVSYDARFLERDGVWTFAGYELDALSGDVVTVTRFADVPVGTRELLSTTQESYLSLAADLGLEPVPGTRFVYYPNAATMRAIARPAADRDTRWLVPSAGLVEIAWGQPITPALANLALDQMGLPPGAAPWLREGLAARYDTGYENSLYGVSIDREYLPALSRGDVLTPLLDLPLLDDLADGEAQTLRGQAWSGMEYLLERFGTAGLRDLCAAWGQTGNPDAAFQQALGLYPAQFEDAWRAERLDPLRADVEAIQDAVDARAEAVLAGDAAAFLATVNPADPVLRTEERNWFADLVDHPVLSYTAEGQVIGWTPDDEQAVVALTVSSVISGGASSRVTYDARFVHAGGRWRYAGVAWNELADEHFVLKYQDHEEEWARRVLDLAEAAYERVVADLDAAPPPQEIKIYDDGELFRTSVFLSLPQWASGWTEPGEAIKLQIRDGDERTIQRFIAHELVHQVLFAQGLESHWLHEGVANFVAGRALPLGTHWMAGRYMSVVQEAVRRHNELPWYSMPSWEEVPDEQAELFYAQSWSLVSLIAQQHGMPGLRRFIARSIDSDDTAANLRAALAVDPDSFLAAWREHAYAAGVPDDLIPLAQRFDPERALTHITALSSPEYGGREAGTAGADLAAAYIADRFAALGLVPVGDPPMGMTATLAVTGTSPLTGELGVLPRSYVQRFPISHTHLITIPTLTLLDADGDALHPFTYRQDFLESGGQGFAEGELVWVRAGNLEGMRFGGAVILERDVRDPIARAAQLQEHGAGGLIVVTDKEPDDLQTDYVRPTAESRDLTIPVFEITGTAFETLLQRLGVEYRDLASAPPALPLDVQVHQSLARSPITATLTANVLGLWPGSDPRLADEVLIVGAHYDHIGQSPDGLYFPGANQNASGVAALLEMARVWQSAGFRPTRSVLFAAWGAEELGSAGMAHYLDAPAVPLTRTVGVLALDSIAAGGGPKLMFYGTREHDQSLIQRVEAAAARLDRRAWRRGSTGEGWHTPLNQAGIPTVKFIWDDAESDFYLPSDTADRIDLNYLATSGEILTLSTAWLAGW
jgi:Zn-dependent M28 family amino/carboxypeptidase